MSNQYCHILSWIKHDKEHGDPEFAEAIQDLCLDNLLTKSRKYPGLTFLYPDKKVRDHICKGVFTKDSREVVEEFKRYILPEVFETCESFNSKEVGNILGYSYPIKSATSTHVTFANGMEIKCIKSFTTLNAQIEDMVRIYIVTKGHAADSGEPYSLPFQNKKRGGLPEEGKKSKALLIEFLNTHLMIEEISDEYGHKTYRIRGAFLAFFEIAKILKKDIEFDRNIKDLLLAVLSKLSTCDTGCGIIEYLFFLVNLVYITTNSEKSNQMMVFINSILSSVIPKLAQGEEIPCQELYDYLDQETPLLVEHIIVGDKEHIIDDEKHHGDANILTTLGGNDESFVQEVQKLSLMMSSEIMPNEIRETIRKSDERTLMMLNNLFTKFIFQGKFPNQQSKGFATHFKDITSITSNLNPNEFFTKESVVELLIFTFKRFLRACNILQNFDEIGLSGRLSDDVASGVKNLLLQFKTSNLSNLDIDVLFALKNHCLVNILLRSNEQTTKMNVDIFGLSSMQKNTLASRPVVEGNDELRNLLI